MGQSQQRKGTWPYQTLSEDKGFWEHIQPHLDRLTEEQRHVTIAAIKKERNYRKAAERKRRKREGTWPN